MLIFQLANASGISLYVEQVGPQFVAKRSVSSISLWCQQLADEDSRLP